MNSYCGAGRDKPGSPNSSQPPKSIQWGRNGAERVCLCWRKKLYLQRVGFVSRMEWNGMEPNPRRKENIDLRQFRALP